MPEIASLLDDLKNIIHDIELSVEKIPEKAPAEISKIIVIKNFLAEIENKRK
jgi:hypothetical protein